ncbi:Hypothetical protein A7982_01919 [Minicystis rosea]|nr:Hypothetical protein A7982_01919 [Minicystis rosea]
MVITEAGCRDEANLEAAFANGNEKLPDLLVTGLERARRRCSTASNQA